MARFQKTRLRAASAISFLLALYALAGLAYAAWMHSAESVEIWAAVAVVSSIVGIAYHVYVLKKEAAQ